MVHAKKLLNNIVSDYGSLEFCQRWLINDNNKNHINMAMRQLINSGAIYAYHVLKEKSDARVAQAEHTVIVEKDGCKIITL
jgi:methionyl aminopeptidase